MRKILPKMKAGASFVKDYIWDHGPEGAVNSSQYADFIDGKNIVIVGPAPYLDEYDKGEWIDGHDLVVRINHALPVPEERFKHVGQRTDILYHNLWKDQAHTSLDELVPKLKLTSWLCAAKPYIRNHMKSDIDYFLTLFDHKVPFRTVSSKTYMNLFLRLKSEPNSGIMAILDLLRFNIKSLSIAGFTFYHGPAYYNGYQGEGLTMTHDKERQKRYFTRVILKDRRILIDDHLRSILN